MKLSNLLKNITNRLGYSGKKALILGVMMMVCSGVWGATFRWKASVASGDWNTIANWEINTGGASYADATNIPTADDTVYIGATNNTVITIPSGATAAAKYIYTNSDDNKSGNVTLTIDGTLTVTALYTNTGVSSSGNTEITINGALTTLGAADEAGSAANPSGIFTNSSYKNNTQSGSSGTTLINVNTNTTITNLYVNSIKPNFGKNNSTSGTVTINTALGTELTIQGRVEMSGRANSTTDTTLNVTGAGEVSCKVYDPAIESGRKQTVNISSGATFNIKDRYYGDAAAAGISPFTGSGTLKIPASGAYMSYGNTCGFTYANTLKILANNSDGYYSVEVTDLNAFPGTAGSPPAADTYTPISIKLICKNLGGSAIVYFPFKVTKLVNTNTPAATFRFDKEYPTVGGTEGTYTLSSAGASIAGYLGVQTSASQDTSNIIELSSDTLNLNPGDGFEIEIWTPDKARVLTTIEWYFKKPGWTGAVSKDWSDVRNWAGLTSGSTVEYTFNTEYPSYNLTINASATRMPDLGSGSYNLGSLKIAPNASMTISGGSLKTPVVTVADSGTYASITQTGGTLEVRDLTVNGSSTFASTGGTVIFYNDTTDPTLTAAVAGNVDFYNLEIKSGSFTIPSDLTVKGSLKNDSGATVSNAYELKVAGDFTNEDTWSGSGKIILNGTGSTEQTFTPKTGTTYPKIEISKDSDGVLTFNSSENLNTTTLTITQNGTTNLNGTSVVGTISTSTTSGDINFNNTTTIKSATTFDTTGNVTFASGFTHTFNDGSSDVAVTNSAGTTSLKGNLVASTATFSALDVTGTPKVTANLVTDGTVTTTSAATLQIAGDLTDTSSSWSNDVDIEFVDVNSAFTPSSNTYNSITVNKSGITVTPSATFTANTVTVTAGTISTAAGFTASTELVNNDTITATGGSTEITVKKFSGTGTINSAGGTVKATGTAVADCGTLAKLVLQSGTTSIQGNLTVTEIAVETPGTTTANLTIGTGAADTSTPVITTLNLNQLDGTVTFNNEVSISTLTLTGKSSSYPLTVTGSGSIILASDQTSAKFLSVGNDVKLISASGATAGTRTYSDTNTPTTSEPAAGTSDAQYAAVIRNGWLLKDKKLLTFKWKTDAASADWTDAANWDIGLVPVTDATIEIQDVTGSGTAPAISTDVAGGNITIDTNASLTFSSTGNLILSGNAGAAAATTILTNKGTIVYQNDGRITNSSGTVINDVTAANNGTVEYNTGSGTITEIDSTLDYYNLKISGGTWSCANTVNATNLTITSGTISGTFTSNTLSVTGDCTASADSTFITDEIALTANIDGGTTAELQLYPKTAAKTIYLGDDVASNFSLSATEISKLKGKKIIFGENTTNTDNIIINETFTSSYPIDLLTKGSITASGDYSVSAGSNAVTLSAATGIGTSSQAIKFASTQTGLVDATNSTSGDLYLNLLNTAGATLGGVSATLKASNSNGDISITTGGAIALNDDISTSGNISLTATGSITKTSGTLTASTVTLTSTAGIGASGAPVTLSASTIDLSASTSGNIYASNDKAASYNATATSGTIEITNAGTLTIATGKLISTTNKDITLKAADFVFTDTPSVTAGTGTITLTSDTAAGAISLKDSDIGKLSVTGGLVIGDNDHTGTIEVTDNSSPITLTAPLTVRGKTTITFTNAATIDTNGKVLTVKTHLTNNGTINGTSAALTFERDYKGSGTLVASTGNTTFKRNADLSSTAFTANGGTVIFNRTTDTNHTLTVKTDKSTTFNNITINSGSYLTCAGEFNITGNWTNNGTFTGTGSTIHFAGTSEVQGSAVTTFNNLTIDSGKTLKANVTATEGNLIKLSGDWTNNAGTTGFDAKSGTVQFTDSSTITGETIFQNFTASDLGGKTLTLNNDVTINGSLTLNGTAAVAGPPAVAASYLTVTDDGSGYGFILTNGSQPAAIGGTAAGSLLKIGSTVKIKTPGTPVTCDGIEKNFYKADDSVPSAAATNAAYAAVINNGWRIKDLKDLTYTWIGGAAATATDWTNRAHWDIGIVPGVTTAGATQSSGATVIIPDGKSSYPELAATAYSVGSLTIGSSPAATPVAKLTLNGTADLTVSTGAATGTLTNYSQIIYSNSGRIIGYDGNAINDSVRGSVEYNTATGTMADVTYYDLKITGGNWSNTTNETVAVNHTFTVENTPVISINNGLTCTASTITIPAGTDLTLGGTINSGTNTQTYNCEVKLSADTTFSSPVKTGKADVTFTGNNHKFTFASTLTGTPTAGTPPTYYNIKIDGTVDFYGNVSDFKTLILTKNTEIKTSNLKLDIPVEIENDLTLSGQAVEFKNNISGTGKTLTLTTTASFSGASEITANILNKGTINVPAVADAGTPPVPQTAIAFKGTYTANDTPAGSLVGSGTANPYIDFYSDAIFGDFTANSDTVRFVGTASQNFTANTQTFYAIEFNNSNGVTLTDTINISNKFTNTSGFTAGSSSTVQITDDTSIHGDSTFQNFSCTTPGKTISFENGKTQTINGVFTITGASGSNILLRSLSSPNKWNIKCTGPEASSHSIQYADVMDSENTSDYRLNASNSTDSQNNIRWNFITVTYTWTGANSTNWFDQANWDKGSVPGIGVNVIIPDSSQYTNPPELTHDLENSHTIYGSIGASGTLTVNAGAQLDLKAYSLTASSITNNGLIRLSGAQTINGSTPGSRPIFTNNIDSTVEYYGPLRADNKAAMGTDYAKLEFSSGAEGEISEAITVNQTTLIANGTGKNLSLSGQNIFTGDITIGQSSPAVTGGVLSITTAENITTSASVECDNLTIITPADKFFIFKGSDTTVSASQLTVTNGSIKVEKTNSSNTLEFNLPVTIGTDLLINNGKAIFNNTLNVVNISNASTGCLTTNSPVTVAGNFTNNGTSTDAVTNNSAISIAGNLTDTNANWKEGTGYIIFNGTTDQTFSTNAATKYFDITVNKDSGNFKVTPDLKANTFTITKNAEATFDATTEIDVLTITQASSTNFSGLVTIGSLTDTANAGNITFATGGTISSDTIFLTTGTVSFNADTTFTTHNMEHTAGTTHIIGKLTAGDITLQTVTGADINIYNSGIFKLLDATSDTDTAEDLNCSSFTQTGTGISQISGDITTSTGNISFTAPVQLTGNVKLSAKTNAIFNSTINDNSADTHNLIISAEENTTFIDSIGNTNKPLDIEITSPAVLFTGADTSVSGQKMTVINGSITVNKTDNSNTQNFNLPVSIGTDLFVTKGKIFFNDTTTSSLAVTGNISTTAGTETTIKGTSSATKLINEGNFTSEETAPLSLSSDLENTGAIVNNATVTISGKLSTSGTLTANAPVTVTGNFINTGTATDAVTNNSTISIAGNLTDTNANWKEGAGFIVFNGTADQTFNTNAETKYFDVTVNKASGNFKITPDFKADKMTITKSADSIFDATTEIDVFSINQAANTHFKGIANIGSFTDTTSSGNITFLSNCNISTDTTFLTTGTVTFGSGAAEVLDSTIVTNFGITPSYKNVTHTNGNTILYGTLNCSNAAFQTTECKTNILINCSNLTLSGNVTSDAAYLKVNGNIITSTAIKISPDLLLNGSFSGDGLATLENNFYLFGIPEAPQIETGTVTVKKDLIIDAPRNILTSGTISATNIVIYRGNILAKENSTLTASKDFVILGTEYDIANKETGNSKEFVYQQERLSKWNYSRSDFTSNSKPEDTMTDNTVLSTTETKFSGTYKSDGNSVIHAGINFYANGTALTGAETWYIDIPDITDAKKGFAESINSTVSNSTIRCHEDSSADGSKAKMPAFQCEDSGSNANWLFDNFQIVEVHTERDNVLKISFNRPIRNNNSELLKSISRFSNNTEVYEGFYTDPDCQNPLKVGNISSGSIYLKATNTWNTDATGKSAGTDVSTDRYGNHKQIIPYIQIKALLENSSVHISDIWGKRIINYDNDKRFVDVTDKTGPVLYSVRTGQEMHTPYDSVKGAECQPSYDSHNFVEFRYSEKVNFGTTTLAETLQEKSFEADNQDISKNIWLPAAASTMTSQFPNIDNIRVRDSFGALQNDITTAGALILSGIGTIESGLIYTGTSGNPDKYNNALYRTDPYSIRLSIAGLTDGTVKDRNGDIYKKWTGYIESAVQPSGTVTMISSINNNVTDCAYALDGKTPVYNPQELYKANQVIPSVNQRYSDNTPYANSGVYGSWDLSEPVFAPLRLNTATLWGNKDYYEAVGNTSGAGSTLDKIEFHLFDNTPSYSTLDPANWLTEKGWCNNLDPSSTTLYDESYTYCADIIGGARQFDANASQRTTGGIRYSSINNCAPAFKYIDLQTKNAVPDKNFDTSENGIYPGAKASLFIGSSPLRRAANDPDGLYFGIGLSELDLPTTKSFTISYDDTKGYITDLAGNRLRSATIKSIDRTPPSYDIIISPVNQKEVYAVFVKKLVTDSSALKYRNNKGDEVTITEQFETLIPRCFELISIDSTGKGIVSENIQIDYSIPARIENIESNFNGQDFTILRFTLTSPVTLNAVQNLYMRTKHPEGYDELTQDPITGINNSRVSFIQDSIGNFMQMFSAHTLSDISVSSIDPLYAYNSDMTYNSEIIMDGLYEAGSWAVHDWNEDQQNYGTLPADHPYGVVADVITATDKKEDLPAGVRIFLSAEPDKNSISTQFNSDLNRNLRIWLPEVTKGSLPSFSLQNNPVEKYFQADSTVLSEESPERLHFSIPKEVSESWGPGQQITFLFGFLNADGTPFRIYPSPYFDVSTNLYNLSKTDSVPLYSVRLKDPGDITSLDLWSFKTKATVEQRGGVTILNNVINASNGEKTVIKVNTPVEGKLNVIVMTLDGNIVTYLNHGQTEAGEHYFSWNGTNNKKGLVARGMYFIRVIGDGIDETRKVMVVK